MATALAGLLSRPNSPAPSTSSSTDSNAPLPSFQDLAPPRPFLTAPAEETVISIPDLTPQVKLKVDAGPGCGGIAWPAGEVGPTSCSKIPQGFRADREVLSRYLAYRQSIDATYLQGKKVLELGSGTGLVGIVAGLLESTAEIWVTDQMYMLGLHVSRGPC